MFNLIQQSVMFLLSIQRKSYKEFEVGNKFKLTQDQVSKLVDVRLFEEREMKYIPEDELIEV